MHSHVGIPSLHISLELYQTHVSGVVGFLLEGLCVLNKWIEGPTDVNNLSIEIGLLFGWGIVHSSYLV